MRPARAPRFRARYLSTVAIARLTRTVQFAAAHRYYRPDWSEARNREAFGPCANPHGHGHTYQCSVTVTGEIGDDRSMVMDLTPLDDILHAEVVKPLDHQHMNHAVPEFAYGKQLPTAEALAVYLWRRILPRLPEGVRLHCVRVDEDARLHAEYYGE